MCVRVFQRLRAGKTECTMHMPWAILYRFTVQGECDVAGGSVGFLACISQNFYFQCQIKSFVVGIQEVLTTDHIGRICADVTYRLL